MSYDQTMLRLGSTAIAAILALSATPVLAQSSDPAPAPVTITPPAAPAVTPDATPTPAAAPMTVAPATTPAPAPTPMATQSTPVMHVADDSADASSAQADKPAPKTTAHRTVAKSASKTEAAPKPATAPPAPAESAAAPMAALPAAATAPAPVVQPVPAAPKAANPAPTAQADTGDMLMIGGAGALGILALAGGGYALRRRKRRDDEEEVAYAYEPETTEVIEPAMAAPLAVAPASAPIVPATTAEETLPEGFDISHYGRHAQAAFRGPTPDNPSLSLKTRLKRAAFFDKRERVAAEAGAMPQPTAKVEQLQTITRPAPAEQVVYRPQRLTKSSFRPVFSTSRS